MEDRVSEYYNSAKLLNKYCQSQSHWHQCNEINLEELIIRYKNRIISEFDNDNLFKYLICNSKYILDWWGKRFRIFAGDTEELEDYFDKIIEGTIEYLNWISLQRMEGTSNVDFLKHFNYNIKNILRGPLTEFKKEQILYPSIFLEDVKEYEIFSEEIIGNIEDQNYVRKTIEIVRILNDEILTDVSFFIKIEKKINHIEISDATKTYMLRAKNIIEGKSVYKNLEQEEKIIIKRLNYYMVLDLFPKTIIGIIRPPESLPPDLISNKSISPEDLASAKDILNKYCKERSLHWFIEDCKKGSNEKLSHIGIVQGKFFTKWIEEEFDTHDSDNLVSIIIREMRSGGIPQNILSDCNNAMNFLKCLIIEYGARSKIRIWNFIDESRKRVRLSFIARKQKSRFHKNIAIYYGTDRCLFRACHGDRYNHLFTNYEGYKGIKDYIYTTLQNLKNLPKGITDEIKKAFLAGNTKKMRDMVNKIETDFKEGKFHFNETNILGLRDTVDRIDADFEISHNIVVEIQIALQDGKVRLMPEELSRLKRKE